MTRFPEVIDLIAFFRSEPVVSDASEASDLFYNETTYRFTNAYEQFIVVVSPAMQEVSIQVTHLDSGHLISSLSLKQVKTFEIMQDDAHASRILLTLDQGDILQTVEIDLLPRFCQQIQEHWVR